jgi:hypothetical protein
MFWYWWKVEPLSDDPKERVEVLSPDFWQDDKLPATQFTNGEFGFPAAGFWGGVDGSGFEDGRLLMRGLYLGVPAHWCDRWIVWALLKLGY